MNIFLKILQALAGAALAAGAAVAFSTWGLPEEGNLLFFSEGFRVTAAGAGAGLSLITALAFTNAWIAARRKDAGETAAGDLLNGIGFGLLPAAAVWKCFEQGTAIGQGTPVPAEIPKAAWLTENGLYQPARIEMLLAAALFAAVILWLMLRKEPLPADGDLMGVSLTLMAAGRLVTEGFREGEAFFFGMPPVGGWIAAAVLAAVMIVWTRRAFRKNKSPGYAWGCWAVMLGTVAVLILQRNGILNTGYPPAELAISCCCGALAMKAALCMGRISR